MRRLLAFLIPKSWRRRYFRQQAQKAALALLLAPREEVERYQIREYFHDVSAKLRELEQ